MPRGGNHSRGGRNRRRPLVRLVQARIGPAVLWTRGSRRLSFSFSFPFYLNYSIPRNPQSRKCNALPGHFHTGKASKETKVALSGKEKFARWWEAHRQEREAAYTPRYWSAARVVALLDANGLRWVEAVRDTQEPYWLAVWTHREVCDHPLAQWFRTLPRPPVEHTVLSRLDAGTAKRLAGFLADEAGDTVLRERTVKRRPRRTWVVKGDGGVEVYRSIAAACRAVGLRKLGVEHSGAAPTGGRPNSLTV